jgi:hypothetical protein
MSNERPGPRFPFARFKQLIQAVLSRCAMTNMTLRSRDANASEFFK